MVDLHSSATNSTNSLEDLSVTKEHHTCGTSGLDSIHELGRILDEALQVNNVNTGTASDHPSYSDESSGHEGETSSKCLQKCATFPIMQLENNTHHLHSLSLPTAPKLVSALKGSWEKEGFPLKKLSVSWAPDVYDPLPTSVSHYPKKKTQQKFRSNKKDSKGKQKRKNTRGGGSGQKDKKHYHKIGGKSCKYVDTNTVNDRVMPVSDYGSSLEILDFTVEEHHEIDCPESNCGSSYRRKAGSTLHFAYAEAT